jgi:hypothetical protein
VLAGIVVPTAARVGRKLSGGKWASDRAAEASVRECHPTLNYAFDDGAESVLSGECPFDSRDDVQERDYPGNLEDPFGDRHTPQHDIELATEFNGVFLRL